jgi:hypothetical protein
MARSSHGLYAVLRTGRKPYDPDQAAYLLRSVDHTRTHALANALSVYLRTNLPKAIERRQGLAGYRTNPYVLLTSASVMSLADPQRFADFLFNTKLYMGLETSFGKSVEAAFVGEYPVNAPADQRWTDPPEKLQEFAGLIGLGREAKARVRVKSVWREIDKSCIVGNRRFLTTIKSGPNCINDTQVSGMTAAIATQHTQWLEATRANHPGVDAIDVVIGLTYGTDQSTNNKENQILVKLLEHGFEEEDRRARPGVLIDQATRSVRVYRYVGQQFWAFIGDPATPQAAQFVFLEVLIALTKALQQEEEGLEDRVNRKIEQLALAVSKLRFPRNSLPEWIRAEFSEDALFWLQTAVSAFYDDGV